MNKIMEDNKYGLLVGYFIINKNNYNLYNLDIFENNKYKNVPLKTGEQLYKFDSKKLREHNAEKQLIKVDLDKETVYFLSDEIIKENEPIFQQNGYKIELIKSGKNVSVKEEQDFPIKTFKKGGEIELSTNKTAYNFVYDRLIKVVPELLESLKKAKYPTDIYGKSQYRTDDFGGNDPYMYLSLEVLEKDNEGRYIISLAHYYLQQGDMMADPDMTVRLDLKQKTVEALTFKMDGIIGRGIIKEVYPSKYQGKMVNTKEKKDQNSFLNIWSNNWVKQQHVVELNPIEDIELTETKPTEITIKLRQEIIELLNYLNIENDSRKRAAKWNGEDGDEKIASRSWLVNGYTLWQIASNYGKPIIEVVNHGNEDKIWFSGDELLFAIGKFAKQKGLKLDVPILKTDKEIPIEIDNKTEFLDSPKKDIINGDFFKGIHVLYENQFILNKAIEEFLDTKTNDYVFSTEEKTFIYKYEGYGGLEKEGATGKVLLWEYYTPELLNQKMWGLAYKYGFTTGKVLEPSVGVGRVLDFSGQQDTIVTYEINRYSARICKIIHPNVEVNLKSFEEHFYNGNVYNPNFEKGFDLVVGNPPYGKNVGKRSAAEQKRLKASVEQFEHYFILRGLDVLNSGGLLIYISTANLFIKGYEKIKERILEKAELIDAYLLPNTTFKRTKINTSLIVLKRR